MSLDDLLAPPPHPRFREKLWERVDERQRVVARRWRIAAIVATAAAVAAASAAGVLAFGNGGGAATSRVYDRTASCPVPIQGGVPAFQVWANTRGRAFSFGKAQTFPGQVAVWVGPQMAQLAAVSEGVGGFGFPGNACTRAPRVPLVAKSLPSAGAFVRGDGLGGRHGITCLSGARITVRIRATLDKTNTPIAATVAVWTGRKPRPLLVINWTPKRMTALESTDCRDRY